ncbi:MAG: acyloxyacyl hydrolase [Chitinophagaceae bacterium]
MRHAIAQNDSIPIIQSTGKLKNMFSVGAGVQHGFIFAHSQDVQNTKGSNPTGVEVILSWQRNDPSTWALCNCFPRQGLSLAYYDYDNAILGKSMTASYFVEPAYKLSNKIFFSFKASTGFTYLSNPFDSIKNPANQSYSTSISGYALVGLGLWFRIHNQWWLNTSANYQHTSNGGMKEPNKGINWPTAGVAIAYQNTSRPYYTGVRTKEKFWRNYPMRWDAGLFGIARRSLDENGNSRRLPLIGLFSQIGKQVGRINVLTLGAEVYRDEKLSVRLKRDSMNANPVKAGIMAGHEFILGKFLFSQRLGIYVFDETPYYDRLFHRWGLLYRINRHLGVGFNMKVHRQVADFVDLRINYTIQKKKLQKRATSAK